MPLCDVRTLRRWPLSRHTGWCARSARAARRGGCSTAPTSTWRRARSSPSWAAPDRASRRCCTCSAGSTGRTRASSRSRASGSRAPASGGSRRLRRRHVGFVFQFFHLLPELSGEANVLLAGRVRGAAPDAAARGAGAGRRGSGSTTVAGSFPHQLSGGEQQRFAIARALVNDPALVLADEPTGNLDVEAGARPCSRCCASSPDEGRAVVIVTHEAAAAAIADRVLRLARRPAGAGVRSAVLALAPARTDAARGARRRSRPRSSSARRRRSASGSRPGSTGRRSRPTSPT